MDDGEIIEDEEFKKTSLRVSYKGVSTYFRLESQIGGDKRVREYLCVLINSKLLHQRYFEGITFVNVGHLYDTLMTLGVVSFSYDWFLKSECTDVDFKKDILCTCIGDLVKAMSNFARDTKKTHQGYNVFKQPDNKGIEFGERKTATKDYPFFKVYHKGLQAMSSKKDGMFVFYSEFLSEYGYDLTNVVRLETTIKNRQHFKRHGIHNTTLESLLNMTQEQMQGFFNRAFEVHLNRRTPKVHMTEEEVENLKPTDTALVIAIKTLMEMGVSFNQYSNTIDEALYNPKAKYRVKKRLNELYDSYIKGKPKDVKMRNMEKVFDAMGWA